MTASYESPAAVRMLELFEAFAALKRPLVLSDLAKHLDIPVSSCFGLVNAARSRGYLYPLKPRGPIYPTKKMLRLAQGIAAHDPVAQRVEGVLKDLRDATGETVVFGKRVEAQVLYLEAASSMERIRYEIEVGDMREIHSNSMGKALLAMMRPKERDAVMDTLSYTPHTPQTLTKKEALNADVERGVRVGWQQNFGESNPDVGAIACGVHINGQPYSVCIAGPLDRMARSVNKHADELMRTCELLASARDTDVD